MRRNFIAQEVSAGLKRNLSMTIAMILTTAISLAMFGGGLLVVRMADNSKQMFLSRVEVQIFFSNEFSRNDPLCTKTACENLRKKLQDIPAVTSVTYISQEQAKDDAINRVFAHQKEMQQLVRDSGLPASFRVKVSNSAQIDTVIEQLNPYPPGVIQILDQRDLVNKIFGILDSLRNATFLLAVLQGIAAMLLMANAIQMAALSRKTEVTIMSLVGASRWYRQLPFILEALIAALVGAFLAVIGIVAVKDVLLNQVLQNASGLQVMVNFSLFDVLVISPWIFLMGAALAIITSYTTLRITVRD